MENGMVVPQKLKVELPCKPAAPLLDVYPKELEANPKWYIFIEALFIITERWKQPKHSSAMTG